VEKIGLLTGSCVGGELIVLEAKGWVPPPFFHHQV
jgi:hypothetical protein